MGRPTAIVAGVAVRVSPPKLDISLPACPFPQPSPHLGECSTACSANVGPLPGVRAGVTLETAGLWVDRQHANTVAVSSQPASWACSTPLPCLPRPTTIPSPGRMQHRMWCRRRVALRCACECAPSGCTSASFTTRVARTVRPLRVGCVTRHHSPADSTCRRQP